MLKTLTLAFAITSSVAYPAQMTENRAQTTDNSSQHFIIQPDHILTPAEIADFATRGIEVQHVLPGVRYLVRANAEEIASERHLRAEHYGALHKIAATASHAAARGTAFATVRILFHDDVAFVDAQQAVESAGGEITRPLTVDFDQPHVLTVRVPSTAVASLAQDERVFGVYGPPLRIKAQNAVAAQLSHVTPLFSAPYNLSGAGVVLSEFELAPADTNHPEFSGRFTSHLTGTITADSQHPTHVAGTMIAQGIDPRAKGMDPAAQLHEFNAQDDYGVMLSNKQNALPPLGIVADNNSWGYILGWCDSSECGGNFVTWSDAEDLFGGYDALDSAPYDAMAKQTPVLFVHSAGNDGSEGQNPVAGPWFQHLHVDNNGNTIKNEIFCYSANGSGTDCPTGTCTPGKSSVTQEPHCETTKHPTYGPFDTMGLISAVKNVMAVGAITPNGFIAGFSSRGPAKDGRVKPDIVAKGTSQYSTLPGNSYGILQGTSMSSPVITGIAGLIVEQYRKTFSGQSPSPQQIKTLIVAGADDLGNPGPDYTYGFGLANAQASVDLIIADAATGSRIRVADIAQGQQIDTAMTLSAAQNVRVALGWIDPEFLPPPDQANLPALVNDLDLKVIGPGGNTVLPYVLDKTNPNANATRGVNHVDNMEEVEITGATPGVYHVIVSGTAITSGATQRYVLVANAPLGAAPVCTDANEPNDTAATATPLASGTARTGRICSQSDVDFFKFEAAGSGTVTVTATDTPLKVTVVGSGAQTTVAANSTATVAVTAGSQVIRIEPSGTIGSNASYTITASFPPVLTGRRKTDR